ncbi:MAG TPA: response regulator transcription factor [Arachnia sp.]|nr:response regulator transcription factor [Arachnia sp.]HMT84976.1 response regulator transcription factor [Arachnia sp.]
MTGSDEVSIALVDDDPGVRQNLPKLLARFGLTVNWTASSGPEALARLRSGAVPSLLAVDVDMPGMTGHDLALRVAAAYPQVVIVMLTALDSRASLESATSAGARGYLLKSEKPELLAMQLRSAMMGARVVSDQLLGRILRNDPEEILVETPALTDREWEVLDALPLLSTNDAIGKRLGISTETVKQHVASIKRKLGVHDRVQAAVWAARYGSRGRE